MLFGVALALAETEKYPTVPKELGITVGWLLLAIVVLGWLWAWSRAESFRRGVLGLEDPRTMAALRIGMGLFTIINFVNLAPYWRMLFSDEGVFLADQALGRFGRAAMKGYIPGEGFIDGWAFTFFAWNKGSVLLLRSEPWFVVSYFLVFFAVLGLYTVGLWSRVTGVLGWWMMHMLYIRQTLYLEGTDVAYQVFFFLLLFARTGDAWSVDNWLRCRRLRRQGLLLEAHEDQGARIADARGRFKQPIYRPIPAWPRHLVVLQLAALYTTTGFVKTGHVWAEGDALYYALNLDHFYRFEPLTQQVSMVFGTTLFRLNTWVTHLWERGFPLVLIGLVVGFGHRHRAAPWYLAEQRARWRIWFGRGALLAAYVLVVQVTFMCLPTLSPLDAKGNPPDVSRQLQVMQVLLLAVVPGLVLLYAAAGRWRLVLVPAFGGAARAVPAALGWWLAAPGQPPRATVGPWRVGPLQLTQDGIRAYTVGRRVWLTLGIIFHGFLILFMNIGMFPWIMLLPYVAFVRGDELAGLVGACVRWARRPERSRLEWLVLTLPFGLGLLALALLRGLAPRGEAWFATPCAPGHAIPPAGRRLPDAIVFALGAVGLGLAYARIHDAPWVGELTWTYLYFGVALAACYRALPPAREDLPAHVGAGPALAYGPAGRTLALLALVWHTTAVGFHLWPTFEMFAPWRGKVRSIHSTYLSATGTSQGWRMFAPNPPRANVFMQTIVVERDGTRWDLRNNAISYRPNPWIINDRMRKMQRRMVGQGSWYQRYWADYQCREWFLATGEYPEAVEIHKLWYRIPTPEMVRDKGWYDPAFAREHWMKSKLEKRLTCSKEGKLPPYMKQRRGMELDEAELAALEREADANARKAEATRQSWASRVGWGRPAAAPKRAAPTTPRATATVTPTAPARPAPTRAAPAGRGGAVTPEAAAAGARASTPSDAAGADDPLGDGE